MRPDPRFAKQDKSFWACVRSLSQHIGYTARNEDRIKIPSLEEMKGAFANLDLNTLAVIDRFGHPTELARMLRDYFEYRAKCPSRNILSNLNGLKLLRGCSLTRLPGKTA